MGAAKAVIVSDDALRGTDALGTAKVLAAVIERERPDLVLAATESSDGYTARLPCRSLSCSACPPSRSPSRPGRGHDAQVERQTESGMTR